MCWSLSLSPDFVTKEILAIEKKYGHMKVQVLKKRKKYGHMKVQEKKEKKRRDSHVLKRFNKGREIIQKEFPLIHHSHTRAHLDLIV